MSANFTPNQNDYKNLTPFKTWLMLQINTWGQNNFPFVESDFDELTNYGMMQKLMKAVNDVIDNENMVETDITNLFGAFTELQSYVNDYFDNLDVQDEINNKLDEMAQDGSLTLLIKNYVDPYIETQNNAIDDLTSRVNGIASGSPIPASSTAGMTDTTRIYVNTTNGYWYYYNGSEWTQGGVYQSAVNPVLSEQNSYLRDLMLNNEFGKNMYNEDTKYDYDGYYYSSNGFVSSANFKCTHPILVKKDVSYSFTAKYSRLGTSSVYYVYVDKNYNVLSYGQGTLSEENTIVSFTAPTDGYVIVNMGRKDELASGFIFAKTSDFPTTTRYDYKYKNIDLETNLANTFNNLRTDSLNNVIMNNNLFNKNSELNIKGKYIASTTYSNLANGIITHPIYLNKGDIVKFYHNDQFGNNYRYAKCNKTGEFITTYQGTIDANNIITATIPETGFYCFNTYKTDDNMMVVKNIEYPNEYIAYSSKLYNTSIPYLDDIIENLNVSNSSLYGKSISLTGDSICYGAGYTGGYGKIISDKYNMEYENLGEGGATIATGTTYSGGGNRHWICNDIVNMQIFDYGIVEGGVNDASLGVSLGTLSNGYDATLDTTTFYGAFEYMLKQLISRFAGKKYGYIMVHQMTQNMRIINNESTSYYWAAKKCCEKWGVPFLDLNDKVPPFNFLRNTSLSSLPATYTKDGDGWHPNEDGYKKYYVDKIISWLESL